MKICSKSFVFTEMHISTIMREYERGDITTDPTSIKRIIKEHYGKLWAHKFDNLDEVDQFLKRHNLPNSHETMSLYISPNS